MAISSYSTTPASNTTISSIDIAEGCAPGGINDAIRQMMADIKTDAVTLTDTQSLTNKTYNKVTLTAPATGSTLTIADGKTLTVSNTLTFVGTDGNTLTFPSGSDSVVTLTGTQTLTNKTLTKPTVNGTTTNDAAPAGAIGQYISSSINPGSEVSLSTGVTANVTSIPLTAGDWDVWASVFFTDGASTVLTSATAGITGTSATLPTQPNGGAMANWSGSITGSANTPIFSVGMQRQTLAGNTTIYLVAQASFTTSTCAIGGFLGARRRW